MALDAATLQRLATMPQADAIALLSGMQDLQSIAVTASQGEGSTTYTDATGAGLRAVTANTGEGVGGPTVTGYQKILTPDLEGAADVKGRARFVGNYDAAGKLTGVERQDVGLSGGFLADNLETIGPLAVALAAIAGGMPIDPSIAAGSGNAPAAAATGAGAETGAAIAGIDQVPVATAGSGAGAGAGAGAGGGTAAGASTLDRVLASPLTQQAGAALLTSAVLSQTAKAPAAADLAPTPAPAAPAPTPAATAPDLKPIYASLAGTADTPVSTFLTGPGGIDMGKLRLGRNVLLGMA